LDVAVRVVVGENQGTCALAEGCIHDLSRIDRSSIHGALLQCFIAEETVAAVQVEDFETLVRQGTESAPAIVKEDLLVCQ